MNWLPNYTCMACKDEIQNSSNPYLCPKCMATLPIMPEIQTTHFSPFVYQEPIRNMILQLKYNSNGNIAKALAPYLVAVFLKEIKPKITKAPIIVPVPLHRSRQRERGYNQSELIAQEITTYLKFPVINNLISRIKKTNIQKHMDTETRMKNMRGAFEITPNTTVSLTNHDILLVDDVYTTGATTNECAAVLRANGAQNIYILTIASVI